MKNKLTSYDRIAKVIEDAVTRGSGYAASEAANIIDKEFILIRKSDLPAVEIKSVYSPAKMEHVDRPVVGTASKHGNAPSSYYWKRAIDVLAMAQYVEQEEVKQAQRELAGKREEAWRLLNPTAPPLWDYNTANPACKAQIDVVVGLMTQVDELKDGK